MNTNRPVNLDLYTVKFPITAIVSILHRVSGVVMLGGIIILIWMLDVSLTSQEGFNSIQETLQAPLAKIILWGVLAALAYHLVAGIRHLMMDVGVGETLESGKRGAVISIALSAVLILLAGYWVW